MHKTIIKNLIFFYKLAKLWYISLECILNIFIWYRNNNIYIDHDNWKLENNILLVYSNYYQLKDIRSMWSLL